VIPGYLTRWFARPAEKTGPDERPRIAPLASPAPRGLRPAAVSKLHIAANQTADGIAIRVQGEARIEFAGALLDGLLASAACRPPVVTLDLSGVHFISCLAVGVLAGFRRGVVRAGGRVCLAEDLQPEVREALARAGLLDLFAAGAEAAPR
jgi:anti-anti-sigma factor